MKTYLVKKNINIPDLNDNWIIMTGYEFARFMETEDGKRRKRNFARLPQCDCTEDVVVIECSEAKAKALESARLCAHYRKNLNSDFKTISYDCPVPIKGGYCGDDIMGDASVNVEDIVLKSLQIEALHDALDLLDDKGKELVTLMFLSTNPLTEKEYAKTVGICQSSAHERKVRVLNKLRKILENFGFEAVIFS